MALAVSPVLKVTISSTSPGFGDGTFESMEVGAHIWGKISLIHLHSGEQLKVHYVDRASLVNQDVSDFEVSHACSYEQGDGGIRSSIGELFSI